MHEVRTLPLVHHRDIGLLQSVNTYLVAFFQSIPTLQRTLVEYSEVSFHITAEFSFIKPVSVTKSRYVAACDLGSIQPFPMAIPRRGTFNDESSSASAIRELD